jgi:hypothetical protein
MGLTCRAGFTPWIDRLHSHLCALTVLCSTRCLCEAASTTAVGVKYLAGCGFVPAGMVLKAGCKQACGCGSRI